MILTPDRSAARAWTGCGSRTAAGTGARSTIPRPQPRPDRAERLAADVGGTVLDTPQRPVVVVERRLPLEARLDGLRSLPDPVDPRQPLILIDTETTGLGTGAGTLPFLVGVGRWQADTFVTRQLLLPEQSDEAGYLSAVANLIPAGRLPGHLQRAQLRLAAPGDQVPAARSARASACSPPGPAAPGTCPVAPSTGRRTPGQRGGCHLRGAESPRPARWPRPGALPGLLCGPDTVACSSRCSSTTARTSFPWPSCCACWPWTWPRPARRVGRPSSVDPGDLGWARARLCTSTASRGSPGLLRRGAGTTGGRPGCAPLRGRRHRPRAGPHAARSAGRGGGRLARHRAGGRPAGGAGLAARGQAPRARWTRRARGPGCHGSGSRHRGAEPALRPSRPRRGAGPGAPGAPAQKTAHGVVTA